MIWCILLVDDDNRFRSTLARLLRMEHYLVDDVGTGTAAVRLIEKRRFDLLITDYDLRDMINGSRRYRKVQSPPTGEGQDRHKREPRWSRKPMQFTRRVLLIKTASTKHSVPPTS